MTTTHTMNGYTIYKKPDPFGRDGFKLIVAGPEEYGIKLSAKQCGWKRWKKDVDREEAFALAKAHNTVTQ